MIKKIMKLALAFVTYLSLSVSSFAFEASNPQCIAPANPGGGWDFTCRSVGKTLQDLKLIPGSLEVTNMAGGGGGVAYAEVVNKRGGDNNLIVAASSATATRLAQGAYPGNTIDQVRWLGSIGADYGIISVRSIKYVSFDGGGDAVTQLLAGTVQAFTGDVSEAKGFVDSGDIKVLAVLSAERLPGEFSSFPTAKEQGVDAIGANWRGFYVPGNMSNDAYNYWANAISTMYDTPQWKETMGQNGLAPLDLSGDEFQKFVAESVQSIQDLSKEIGLIK